MASESGTTRRRYGSQFKAMELAQCDEHGMSVAKVAMSHGINDNVVHRWRQLARQQRTATLATVAAARSTEPAAAFVPLTLPASATLDVKTEVRLDIQRGAVTGGVAWPQRALGDVADFVRELLK